VASIKKPTLNVLLISFSASFPPVGADVHSFECLKQWLTNPHVSFIIVQDANPQHTLLDRAPIVPRLETRRRFGDFGSATLRIFANLWVSLRSPRPDITIALTHNISDLVPAFLVAKLRGSKLVVYVHHLFPNPSRTPRSILLSAALWLSQLILFLLVLRRTDLVFTPHGQRAKLKPWIPRTQIVELRNGVSVMAAPRSQESKTRFSGSFVGRLSIEKGTADLVRIWHRVAAVIPDATLAIVGHTEEWLPSRSSAYDLKKTILSSTIRRNVAILLNVDDLSKFNILRDSRCFLFPSYEEGWGIAVTEALACGVPVVAYDLPAYGLFKHGITTVPLGNTERFSLEVLKLLQDSDLHKRMVARGFDVLNHLELDWKAIAEQEWLSIGELVQNGARQ